MKCNHSLFTHRTKKIFGCRKGYIGSMAWYQRMGINVARMITLVESRPEIWDPAETGYSDRDLKADAWLSVCTGMYPDWDSGTAALHSEILKDVKNRWWSVRDRYKKHEKDCEKSGMSPSQKKCPYQEQLRFLRTSRVLRASSGNIGAAPPTDTTASPDKDGPGQEPCDDESREGTPALEDSQRSTPDLNPTSVSPEVGEQIVSCGNTTAPASRACVSRVVTSARASRSVAAGPRRKNSKADATQEALSLLRRSETADQWDTMGTAIASRLRELSSERQWTIPPVLYTVLEIFGSPRAIADSTAIIVAMKNAAFPVQHSNRMLPAPQSFPDQPPRVSRTPVYPMHHGSPDTGYGDTASGGSPSQASFLSLMNSPLQQTSQQSTSRLCTPPNASQCIIGENSFTYTTLE
ncbi:uncharacterized protein [Eleutherodactylus coqui]|uniref:uncharacterized protein n=1 Tax=Eleutherodactylus coqui TaxID=57060 RepID=UPI00346224DA